MASLKFHRVAQDLGVHVMGALCNFSGLLRYSKEMLDWAASVPRKPKFEPLRHEHDNAFVFHAYMRDFDLALFSERLHLHLQRSSSAFNFAQMTRGYILALLPSPPPSLFLTPVRQQR